MNIKKVKGFIVILVVSCLFWTGYSSVTSEIISGKQLIQQRKNGIYYEIHSAKEGNSIPASVVIKNEKIITFTQIAGGLTPRERASILTDRLRNFVKTGKNPWNIYPGFKNGIAIVKDGADVLFTVDVKNAKSVGMSVSDLALKWTNNIRRALGAAELIRDYELLKVIGKKHHKIVGYNETGIASWYGGYFHGRTAADGSIYNMYQFTAAHKYLPFGSIVKVTNLKTSDSCLVKITDRGPFIGERIIDLSKIAAEEIGMLHKGISEVKIEVIGKV